MRPHHLALVVPALLLAACAPVEKTDETKQASATSRTTDTTIAASTTTKPSKCSPVPPEVMASIAKGLLPNYQSVQLTDAYGVVVDADDRNAQGWPGYVIAARIVGNGFADGDIGTWAIKAYDGNVSPIYALNAKARQATDWGALAREGSPADNQRKALERLGETDLAEKCARERKAV